MKPKRPARVLWIIGGGQLQIPLIEEARKLDLATLVTDRSDDCVARPYADIFHAVDIFDIGASLDLLLRIQAAGEIEIAGVLAAGIDANVTAAVLARTAGLPGVDPRAAFIVHHKATFRRFLASHKLPCPAFAEVTLGDDAWAQARRVGAPFIVKNVNSSASRGTKKFFEMPARAELDAAVAGACDASFTGTALIEELVDGPEQTVETLYDRDGVFHRAFITDRAFDRNNPYAVEIGLRHPSALPPAVQRRLYALTERTADALGITIGAAKADMILTRHGPMMIEMTTRLSGGFDSQYLVPAATGKNVLRAAILTALGRRFPAKLLSDRLGKIGVTGSLWPKPGRIVSIEGVEQARAIEGVEQIFFRSAVGDTVAPYTDAASRVCFIIATGVTEAVARRALDRATETIRIVTA